MLPRRFFRHNCDEIFLKLTKKSKKIAILVPNFSEFSGDARVAELQARRLENFRKEITIFTLNKQIHTDIDVQDLGKPKSLFWQRIYYLIFPFDLIKTFRFLSKLKSFDLVISHLYPMNWIGFLAKRLYGIKYVYWYHGIPYPDLYPHLYERLYLRIFILMTKITVKNADLTVSVSKFAQKEFKNYTGLDSIVVYNKPDFSRFRTDINGSEIRRRLNLEDNPVILNVGRVCPQKGAHLLIESFKLIKQEIPNAKLVIIGKHTYNYYSRKLKEMVDDSVIFSGFVPDDELPHYYETCDIYATCSLWESFNIPIAEAQACGKSVVAFDVGPHSEIINSNGVLVEVGNVKAFAESCIRKLHQERGLEKK